MKRRWKIFWIVCAALAGIGVLCCAAAAAMGVTPAMVAERFPNGIRIDDDYDDLNDIFDGDDYDDDDYDDDDYDYDDDDAYAVPNASHPAAGGGGTVTGHHVEEQDAHHSVQSAGAGTGTRTGAGTGSVTGDFAETSVQGSFSRSFSGISGIEIDIDSGQVELVPSADNGSDVVLEAKDVDERLRMTCRVKAGKLRVVAEGKLRSGNNSKVTLYLPQNCKFNEVSAELAAGEFRAQNVSAGEFSVDVDAGTAVIENFSADEASLECGIGSLEASGSASVETDVSCGIGEAVYTAPGAEHDYNYEIECGGGVIDCGGNTFGPTMEKTINNHAARSMELSCETGSLTVRFVDQL